MLVKVVTSLCLGIAGAVVVNCVSDKMVGRDDNKILNAISSVKDKVQTCLKERKNRKYLV